METGELGKRLRQRRLARGLSLRDLSRQTGVAISFLSVLEGGKTSVSVAKLKTILAALGCTLGAFFGDDSPPTRTVFTKGDLARAARRIGGIAYREVAAGRPDRLLQLTEDLYEPGADTGSELYAHEGQEAGLVLSGRLELTVENEVHRLGPGDAYYFDSRRPHRMRNAGRTRLRVVSANTPASF